MTGAMAPGHPPGTSEVHGLARRAEAEGLFSSLKKIGVVGKIAAVSLVSKSCRDSGSQGEAQEANAFRRAFCSFP